MAKNGQRPDVAGIKKQNICTIANRVLFQRVTSLILMATKLHAGQPKTKITFDIDKQLKCGLLRKQGGKGAKSFKQRFFVLYKNFLVYYDDQTKWQYDCTVGRLEVKTSCSDYHIKVNNNYFDDY